MILPTPASGFVWRDTEFGPALVCAALDEVAPHLFTTKLWEPGDEPAGGTAETLPDATPNTPAIDTDIWSKAARALALAPDELVRMKQVHGHAVIRAARAKARERVPADIAICDDTHLGVAVQVTSPHF